MKKSLSAHTMCAVMEMDASSIQVVGDEEDISNTQSDGSSGMSCLQEEMKKITHHLQEREDNDNVKLEWQMAAVVVDRCLFMAFLLAQIAMLIFVIIIIFK